MFGSSLQLTFQLPFRVNETDLPTRFLFGWQGALQHLRAKVSSEKVCSTRS